jgi:predicted TPR repeat methyltransferase
LPYGKGHYENARHLFARAAELQPGDPDILFNLALSKKRAGDPLGAIDTYKQVLALDSVCIDALYNLVGCYKDGLQYAEAMAAYRKVLLLAPEHQAAKHMIAALTGELATSSPDLYVKEVFDNYCRLSSVVRRQL